MQRFEITGPDGKRYEVTAPSVEAAQTAAAQMFGGASGPEAPAPPPAPPAPPPEPTWMDSIMEGADTVGGYVAATARGARRGITGLAGVPVDVMNMALSPLGLASENPIGGSASLDSAVRLGGALPDYEPEGAGERVVSRAMEEVGAAALPVAGIATGAARLGVSGARQLSPTLARLFETAALRTPASYATRELTAAGAAGLGAGVAREAVTDGDQSTETTAESIADIVGMLGGVGLYGGVSGAARNVGDVFGWARGSERLTNDVVGDAVTAEIARAAGIPADASGIVDTRPLASTIRASTENPDGVGQRVEQAVPGFRPSLSDVSGEPGIASLEYSRQSGANAGRFTERRIANQTRVNDAVESNRPQATPGSYTSEARPRRDEVVGRAEATAAADQLDADAAVERLRPERSAEVRGSELRGQLDEAKNRAREVEREAWSRVQGTADAEPLAAAFNNLSARLNPSEQRVVADLQAAFATPAGLAEAGPADIGAITALRGELTDAIRAADGQPNRQRIINRYVEALDAYLDSAPDIGEALRGARQASFDFNERFTRRGTPTADVLARNSTGGPTVRDSAVAGRFTQPDTGQASDIDRVFNEVGENPLIASIFRDEIIDQATPLLSRPERFNEFLAGRSRVFDNVPGVRDELADTANKQATARASAETAAGVRDQLFSGNKSTVARYLSYGDERARDAMASVVSARDPAAATDELLRFVDDAPTAVEGARAAFWRLMEGKARSTGSSTRGLGGAESWQPNSLYRFLSDPANQAVAARLYRDDPDHLKNINEIAETLRSTDMRVTGRAPNSSGTPEALRGSGILPSSETLASRAFAVQRGVVGVPFTALNIATIMARKATLRGRTAEFQEILDKALLEPEFAAKLLEKHNPADLVGLRRSSMVWAGDLAPQVLDILDEDETDASIEDQIMLE